MRAVIYLLSLLILISPAVAEDWSMFKKDVSHSGYSSDPVNPPLVMKWVSNLGFDTDSSPIVVNGVLYIGSNYGIHALDASSGRELWNIPSSGFIRSVPAVADGTLYTGSESKRFFAAIDTNGTIKWVYENATEGYLSSPAVVDNLAYVGSKDGNLYAMDIQAGQPYWFASTGKGIDSSPAYSDGSVYAGNDNGVVFAFDSMNGNIRWRYYTDIGAIKSSPAVSNGLVFIGSDNGNIYALTSDKGLLKWKYSTGNNIESSPSVKDGTVFVGSKDSNLYAIDSLTGNLKWKYQAAGLVDSSPAISNDIVYFGSKNNFIYALDANTGSLLWRNSTGKKDKDYITSPAISGNMLYAATHSGFVYAYASSGPVQATPIVTATMAVPTATPVSSPGATATPVQTPKAPGFEFAAVVLIIAVLIKKRSG